MEMGFILNVAESPEICSMWNLTIATVLVYLIIKGKGYCRVGVR